MRIINGRFKGRTIFVPRNLPVRPTTNKAREGLFNILNNSFDFNNLKVIDLFSGTGSIGFEFISRGSNVVFVDKNLKCFKHISQTLKLLEVSSIVFKKNVYRYVKDHNKNFNIVFADPPYKTRHDDYLNLINLTTKNLLKDKNSILIIEHFKQLHFNDIVEFKESRSYGDSIFSFFTEKSG